MPQRSQRIRDGRESAFYTLTAPVKSPAHEPLRVLGATVDRSCAVHKEGHLGQYVHRSEMCDSGVRPVYSHVASPNLARTSLTASVRPASLSASPASIAGRT